MKERPSTPVQKTIDGNTERQIPRRALETKEKPVQPPLRKDGQPVTRKKSSE
ncbi:MAG: hypothetical protein ACO1QB_00015 [Verrucomicrobiales bacterium]